MCSASCVLVDNMYIFSFIAGIASQRIIPGRSYRNRWIFGSVLSKRMPRVSSKFMLVRLLEEEDKEEKVLMG